MNANEIETLFCYLSHSYIGTWADIVIPIHMKISISLLIHTARVSYRVAVYSWSSLSLSLFFPSFCFDIVYQLELRRHICCVRLFVSVCFDKNSFWYFTLCNADVVDGESEYHKRKRAHMANKADNHGMCQIGTQFIIFFWVIYLERDKYKNNHQKWIRKFFRQSSFSLESLRSFFFYAHQNRVGLFFSFACNERNTNYMRANCYKRTAYTHTSTHYTPFVYPPVYLTLLCH